MPNYVNYADLPTNDAKTCSYEFYIFDFKAYFHEADTFHTGCLSGFERV